ncbi:hypothetical protein [Pseudonocardia hydrocarbonoxydans]|uniref:hypothetical protein n=1 Tax=Pseudonocardia hydrocarbonoxydans TaxID=76726 RepID=UPI0031D6B764
MLLLVLILVMIAFGLLLVGLLSSSIVWAWVSVAVSLAAGAVLAVDWISRRSAVKAGDDRAVGSGGTEDATSSSSPGTREVEPVTEVIPVVRPSGMPSGAPNQAVDPRFGPDSDAQQTVLMPAVQPSGSPSGPSGAHPPITPSSESESPTVTVADDPRSASTPEPGAPAGSVDGTGGGAATVVAAEPVPAAGTSGAPGPAVPAVVDPPAADAARPAAAAEPESLFTSPSEARSPGSGPGTGGFGPIRPVEPPRRADVPAAGPAGTNGTPAGRSADVTAVVDTTAGGAGAADPAPADAAPADRVPADPAPTAAAPADAAALVPPPGDPASGDGAGPSAAVAADPAAPAESTVVDHTPPAAAEADAAPDADPPEEQAEPAVTALVAGLDDEVVVIDEQPRYHVPGCRSLVAAALIPLPAREAVELGFTPCGWCTPDSTLAGRHQATAR